MRVCRLRIPTLIAYHPDVYPGSTPKNSSSKWPIPIEFKIGHHGVERDIDTVLTVRKAVGRRIDLGVDANMGDSTDEARIFL
mgnify:FL=1